MSDNDISFDITGIGKLAKAVPASSWNRLVKTACDTFTQLISPITSTTYGLGQLIQAKFDGMVDAQKVLAADTVARARKKVEKSNTIPKSNPKAAILVKAIESASNESDENIRDIWANLIANEFLSNDVHPEFPKILERLSPADAAVLADIGGMTEKAAVKKAVRAAINRLEIMGINFASYVEEETDFSREHLENLNLIKKSSGQWRLTLIGEEFLKSVADPTFSAVKTEHSAARDGAKKPRHP